jgi:hypothetical protein
LFEVRSEITYSNGKAASASSGLITHRRIAAATPGAFYYYSGHEEQAESESWKREPFNLEVTLRDGLLTKSNVFNRKFSSQTLEQGSAIPMVNDVLFFVVPIWPLGDHSVPQDRSAQMIFVVGSATQAGYTKSTEEMVLNEEECVKWISPTGADAIWVARDKEQCIMRREWRNRSTGGYSQLLTSEIAEVFPDLWMPVAFEERRFIRDRSGENRLVRQASTRILDWKFNRDVSDSLFDHTVPPGSIRSLGSGEFVQAAPGGAEHLDEVTDFFRDRGGWAQKRNSFRSSSRTIAVGALSFLAVFIVSSRWRSWTK